MDHKEAVEVGRRGGDGGNHKKCLGKVERPGWTEFGH